MEFEAACRISAIRLAKTARVITAAAAIMVVVFLSLVLGADVRVKEIGLGLAVAVLIDATIVRMVPAVMDCSARPTGGCPRRWPASCRKPPVARRLTRGGARAKAWPVRHQKETGRPRAERDCRAGSQERALGCGSRYFAGHGGPSAPASTEDHDDGNYRAC